ncbi:MAG: EAL domain-containing protein [Acidimicrobiales bacterium]
MVCLAGTVPFGRAVADLSRRGVPGGTLVVAAIFCAVVAASWFWPLVLYREGHSESVHLDEGLFVIMAVALPSACTVVAFAAAVIVAQAFRRHTLIKAVFNVGQMVLAVGSGVASVSLIRNLGAPSAGLAVTSAAAGAAVFFMVNSLALAAIVAATGSDWRSALVEGLDIRALLFGACVVVAAVSSVGVFYNSAAAVFSMAPLLILRQVVAGHFRARHDRVRTRGLFEATLEANRTFADDNVTGSVVDAAAMLLRCECAALRVSPPVEGELGAVVEVDSQQRWLVVSGRSRTEPFDSSDVALLEALGAVGASALKNAQLYHDGRTQRDQLAAITTSLGEGVCAVNPDGLLTFVNPAAASMLGIATGHLPDHVHALAPAVLADAATRTIVSGTTVRDFETTFAHTDGTTFPVALTASPISDTDGRVTGAVLVFRDITERKQLETQLEHHAFHDPLTGLANRRVFLDHLHQAVLRSERSKETHAVLFADLDRFKVINDSLGHHCGDELLVIVADRMAKAIRPGDLLARLGGDEFTVLLQGIATLAEAESVAERILAAFRAPISLGDGHEVVVTLSVGLAVTTSDKSADDVLRNADVAMYQAKAKGRIGHYEVFDDIAMGARSAERLELETSLRRALEHGEFEVYYQPQNSISTRRITGVEALIRWNHPSRGLVGPSEFIRVAEETGLILPIGRFVLEQACAQSVAWAKRFDTPLKMSINLSAKQFQQAELADQVLEILDQSGADPEQICLEITESLAMEDVERTAEVLCNLRTLGISWAIDDFGTGYSSLGYLKRFPVDVVKIDRTFVDGLEKSEVDTAIVAAIIGLTHTLHMTTIAEGVETTAQLDHLRNLGCEIAQGFLFSRPIPAGEVERLLGLQTRSNRHHLSVVA